jgi:hypothetical protein
VTYHLAALRFRSIGERSARFTDLTLDLTQPGHDNGEPTATDSVVWLRNGGGKSSLLSLFYALILPRAQDFMGRSQKRGLADYIDNGDTSHTVAVWHPAMSTTLLGDPEHILITGAVYEWPDLRRPTDGDASRLNPTWYSFYAIPGVIDHTNLPFVDAEGTPLRKAAFITALRDFNAEHPSMELAVVNNRQGEWETSLNDRGLDPELFRTQKEMNHVEGGVEDLFKFSTPAQFIDFLLDLTAPRGKVLTVADRLSAIADKVASKPTLLSERGFCVDTAAILSEVAETQDHIRTATDAAAQADTRAAELAAAFDSARAQADEKATALDVQAAEAEARKVAADSDRNRANDLAAQYRYRAAQFRHEDAKTALTVAENEQRLAESEAAAWKATPDLADHAAHTTTLESTRAAMKEERREQAPLRRTHDEAAATLRAALMSVADREDAQAATSNAQADEFERAADAHRANATAARTEEANARALATAAQTRLVEHSEAVTAAVADGFLPHPDADVPAEADRRSSERATAVADRGRVRAQRAERPAARTALNAQHLDLTATRQRHEHEQANDQANHAALTARAHALVSDADVRAVLEAGTGDTIDLWAEADTLTHRLTAAIEYAQAEIVRSRAAASDDQRINDAHARTGYLPTSLDAERIRATLNQFGIASEPGWDHLRDNVNAADLTHVLTSPEIARVACGIVIQTHDATTATNALATENEATLSLVGLYTASTVAALLSDVPQRADAHEAVWQRLHPGLIDKNDADAEVRGVHTRETERQDRERVYDHNATHSRALLGDLRRLLTDCPTGHLDRLAANIDNHETTINILTARTTKITNDLAALETAEEHDATREAELTEAITGHDQALTRLTDLAERANQVGTWVAQRDQANVTAQSHSERGTTAQTAEATSRARASELRVTATANTAHATTYRAEAAQCTLLDPDMIHDVVAQQGVPLDTLRSAYQQARYDYHAVASQSVLSEREQGAMNALVATSQALAAVADDVLARARELLDTPQGQDADLRREAIRTADAMVTAAAGRVGQADGRVEAAHNLMTELQQRAQMSRRLVPEEPADASDADRMAAEQEALGQEHAATRTAAETEAATLTKSAAEIRSRAEHLRLLRTTLPDPAPGIYADAYDNTSTEAEADARAAVTHVKATQDTLAAHEKTRAILISNVQQVANRYPDVRFTAKDRILNDPADALASQAADLVNQMRLRAANIDGTLAEIATDQDIITIDLANLVSDALINLKNAERHSQLPGTLGTWANKKFLTIRFDDISETDLRTRIAQTIEDKVASGVKPEGMALLKASVHAAAAPRGFAVKVLKPTTDVVPTSEDITRLGKWSGGEKLTVCVALYCTLAALRAANQGRRGQGGGTLLLDNPIGRASHGTLVRLQRDVAAARHVQLIYTTGVKDPDAVSQFPNVIRLDNRPGRSQNRRYIVEDPTGNPAGEVTGVRVAHTDTPTSATTDTP